MSELLEPYRSKYFISGEINSEVSDREAKMRGAGLHATRTGTSTAWTASRSSTTTGTSTSGPSNTEPLLRLCLESLRSREDMERRRDEVLAVIRS